MVQWSLPAWVYMHVVVLQAWVYMHVVVLQAWVYMHTMVAHTTLAHIDWSVPKATSSGTPGKSLMSRQD